jgi:hypothetical protein
MQNGPWTHDICEDCFSTAQPGRQPVRMASPPLTKCCYCGRPRRDGIKIRQDPKLVACKGEHGGLPLSLVV